MRSTGRRSRVSGRVVESGEAPRSSSAGEGRVGLIERGAGGALLPSLSALLGRSMGMRRSGRVGRATAPVLRSTAGALASSAEWVGRRGSRLLKMRTRRSSVSSGTPGVRVAAPVARSGRTRAAGAAAAGRAVRNPSRLSGVPSRPAAPKLRRSMSPARPAVPADASRRVSAGVIGRRPRTGSVVTTRRAISLVAGRARVEATPNSRTGSVVTARSSAGFRRSRLAISAERRGVSRSL